MNATDTRPAASPDELFSRLDRLGIETTTKHHPAIMTVEEGHEHWADVPGVHCKNLFLKDAKGAYWLLVMPIERDVDLKRLPERIGSKRLSFAQAPRLFEMLGVKPGSVTPFALINDEANIVNVILDRKMMEAPLLNFHPLVNTATTSIAAADLLAFIADCGHQARVVDLDLST